MVTILVPFLQTKKLGFRGYDSLKIAWHLRVKIHAQILNQCVMLLPLWVTLVHLWLRSVPWGQCVHKGNF